MELASELVKSWDGTGTDSISAYILRIGLKPENELFCGPSMEQLQRLMHAHLGSVPFETLDTHFGKRVRNQSANNCLVCSIIIRI